MTIGTVKWFNQTKGYGFIQPDNGGEDHFVHITSVHHAGLDILQQGQKIEFNSIDNHGRKAAAQLVLLLS